MATLAVAVAVLLAGVSAAVTADGRSPLHAASPGGAGTGRGGGPVEGFGAAGPGSKPTTTTGPSTTAAAAPPTAPPPPATVTTDPPTTAAPPPPAPAPLPAAATVGNRFTMAPYEDLGAWIDVFDWSWSFTGGRPSVGPADVDRMASLGVRTLYVQASRYDHPADVVDLDLLQPIIDRAHALGLRVVAWYLPTLTDPAADLRRTLAMAALPVDGVGIDIEARDVPDVQERNARLVAYSAALRQHLPGEVLSAIVLPPVVMEDVNPNYWPGFPWAELAPFYDVWQPMGYWTNRRADSGWRDGYAYTAANIDRVRAHLGWLDAPVHPIGGIGDETTPEQIAGMVQAAAERGALGGSIYDYRTTGDHLWPPLQAFNQ